MRNFVRVRQLALVSGFALITTGMASVAVAEANLNAHLRGAYAFTAVKTCTVSPQPFVEPALAIPPGVSVFKITQVNSGILTFNGDGTGTATARSSSMNMTSAGGSPFSISDVTSNINYTVNPDRTVDTTSSSAFTVVFPAGVGTTGTVDGTVGRHQISHGNTMLVSAPQTRVVPESQVITLSNGSQFPQYRICINSQVSTKLPGQ